MAHKEAVAAELRRQLQATLEAASQLGSNDEAIS